MRIEKILQILLLTCSVIFAGKKEERKLILGLSHKYSHSALKKKEYFIRTNENIKPDSLIFRIIETIDNNTDTLIKRLGSLRSNFDTIPGNFAFISYIVRNKRIILPDCHILSISINLKEGIIGICSSRSDCYGHNLGQCRWYSKKFLKEFLKEFQYSEYLGKLSTNKKIQIKRRYDSSRPRTF